MLHPHHPNNLCAHHVRISLGGIYNDLSNSRKKTLPKNFTKGLMCCFLCNGIWSRSSFLMASSFLPPKKNYPPYVLSYNRVRQQERAYLWSLPCASLQKLLSEERFVSMETDSDEKQLLNQILNAVKVTPSLHEDLQVEVMKVGLMWLPVCVIGTGTNSDSP